MSLYIHNKHTHWHTQKKISRDLELYLHTYSYWHIQKQSNDHSIKKERLDTDTRIFRAHKCMHTLSFSHHEKNSHTTQSSKENVCMCVWCVFVCVFVCVLLTSPPPKSVHVDFKNLCDQNPPEKTQQKMWRSTRRRFCSTENLFRVSAQTISPGKPLLKTERTKKLWRSPNPCSAGRVCRFECTDVLKSLISSINPSGSVRACLRIFAARARTSAFLICQEQAFRVTADKRRRP
jgi:hypothetical protein